MEVNRLLAILKFYTCVPKEYKMIYPDSVRSYGCFVSDACLIKYAKAQLHC